MGCCWAAFYCAGLLEAGPLLSLPFPLPQAENKQKSTGVKEGCMRDIRISLRCWNYALIEIIGLGIFRERKLSQVWTKFKLEAILIPTKSSPKELQFGREGVGMV